MSRSLRMDVRNPLSQLPAAAEFAALPVEAAAPLARQLKQYSDFARVKAAQSWKEHKAPMALYWKVVAVWTRHARLLLNSHGPWPTLSEERSRFEARFVALDPDSEYNHSYLERSLSGDYATVRIQGAWIGWKARAGVVEPLP